MPRNRNRQSKVIAKRVLATEGLEIGGDLTYGSAGLSEAELEIIDGATITTAELNLLDNQVAGATIAVGAESANVINVTIQLTDAAGTDMAIRGVVQWFLSADANGDAIATAHSSAPAIGTDGHMITTLASLAGILVSEADGDIDIDFTETGTLTVYLILVLPNGTMVASGAITHAA